MQSKNHSSFVTVAALALALLAGCGKKEAPAPQSGIPGTSGADPAQAAAQPAAQPTAAPASSPATLTEAQAATKTGDYDKAAQLLLELQKPAAQPLTPQQAAAVANQMRAFQKDLGAAVASGDPKAIAAAQRLRAASTPH